MLNTGVWIGSVNGSRWPMRLDAAERLSGPRARPEGRRVRKVLARWMVIGLSASPVMGSFAQDASVPIRLAASEAATDGVAVPADLPRYRPQFPDAPLSRVEGAVRGQATVTAAKVLAPRQVGASATDQPTLFWHLAASADQWLEIVIQEHGADGPLFERQIRITPGQRAGSLALAEAGVRLRPGVEHEWSVAVVNDPERRSHDTFAMGSIRVVPPEPLLAARVAAAPPRERATILLEAGYWYDALAEMASAAEGGDATLARWQAELLRGEGIRPIELAEAGS